jgi:ABC-type uncharacterized transport system permease subunit
MRLEHRTHSSPAAMLLAPAGAVAFTLLISALLVLWAGAPVGQTYGLLLQGGFGSVFAWSETLTPRHPPHVDRPGGHGGVQGTPIQHRSRGSVVCGRAGGGGGGRAAWRHRFDLPPALVFLLMMLAAALAGALLLLGPALMKTRLGVDEVVTTLLMNFIVLLLVSWMLDGPMKDPAAMGLAPERCPGG